MRYLFPHGPGTTSPLSLSTPGTAAWTPGGNESENHGLWVTSFQVGRRFPTDPSKRAQDELATFSQDPLNVQQAYLIAAATTLVSTEDDLHQPQAVPWADDTAFPAVHAWNMPLRLKLSSLQ